MSWWLWLILGLVLLGVEVLTPGAFFFLFFGVAGVLTALLAALGVADALWAQGLWFSATSVLSLLVFRVQLKKRLEQTASTGYVELQGETAMLRAPLAPGATAQAEFRGSMWTAKSNSPDTLSEGKAYRVERIEGLTLWLTDTK